MGGSGCLADLFSTSRVLPSNGKDLENGSGSGATCGNQWDGRGRRCDGLWLLGRGRSWHRNLEGEGNGGSRSRSVHVLSEDGLGEILGDVRKPGSAPCIRHCVWLVLLFPTRFLESDSFGFETWRRRASGVRASVIRVARHVVNRGWGTLSLLGTI
jgi:hypothetical protein